MRSHALAGDVLDADDLARRAAEHRSRGHRLVFTNGCFDVLHRGHVACLRAARELGDVLIVAVNSDPGVARLKGPGRPVNSAAGRTAVLAALRCVDYVTVFDDQTPLRLIERIRPDVYVKGGDYELPGLPEAAAVAAYGGRVAILGYLPGESTTAIVERIRAVPADGARSLLKSRPRLEPHASLRRLIR